MFLGLLEIRLRNWPEADKHCRLALGEFGATSDPVMLATGRCGLVRAKELISQGLSQFHDQLRVISRAPSRRITCLADSTIARRRQFNTVIARPGSRKR